MRKRFDKAHARLEGARSGTAMRQGDEAAVLGRIADGLRGLPDAEFKARLRRELLDEREPSAVHDSSAPSPVVPILGVYEVQIRVRHLERAERFYREVLGLEVGLRDAPHSRVFLRAGGHDGMLVLQEDAGSWPAAHFALRVNAADIERVAETLRERGVLVFGPVFHAWMPAQSLYFADPDGHDLELCAPLTATQVGGAQ